MYCIDWLNCVFKLFINLLLYQSEKIKIGEFWKLVDTFRSHFDLTCCKTTKTTTLTTTIQIRQTIFEYLSCSPSRRLDTSLNVGQSVLSEIFPLHQPPEQIRDPRYTERRKSLFLLFFLEAEYPRLRLVLRSTSKELYVVLNFFSCILIFIE